MVEEIEPQRTDEVIVKREIHSTLSTVETPDVEEEELAGEIPEDVEEEIK
jgi:hypothetical protein